MLCASFGLLCACSSINQLPVRFDVEAASLRPCVHRVWRTVAPPTTTTMKITYEIHSYAPDRIRYVCVKPVQCSVLNVTFLGTPRALCQFIHSFAIDFLLLFSIILSGVFYVVSNCYLNVQWIFKCVHSNSYSNIIDI